MEIEATEPLPEFKEVKLQDLKTKPEQRKLLVPANRYSALKTNWEQIVKPVVEFMKLQIRMNTRKRKVEIRTCQFTEDAGAIQKAYDFVRAFLLGFSMEDSIAFLRVEDLYCESFQIKDVKTLTGENLSRCIGRIAGTQGKTKAAIENSTKTRIVLADHTIHIMGSYGNIKQARYAICNLILGSPPGKVYSQLKNLLKRIKAV